MPRIIFNSIAPHLQLQVLEKFTYPEYVHFLSCSRKSKTFSTVKNLKRMPHLLNIISNVTNDGGLSLMKVSDIAKTSPVRFYVNQLYLQPINHLAHISLRESEEILNTAAELFENFSITGRRLEIILHCLFMADVKCINRLIKAAKPFKFCAPLEGDVLAQINLDEVSQISFNSLNRIHFKYILNVKSPSICVLSDTTADELNMFLKQWMTSVRDIQDISITGSFPFDQDEAVFGDLPVRTLWNAYSQKSNYVIPHQHYLHLVRFYAQKRNEQTLFFKINSHTFNAKIVDDVDSEFKYLVETYNVV